MAKTRSLVAAVTWALCERGIADPEANLVAWMGMGGIQLWSCGMVQRWLS
jgi:hypothetical protein